MNPQRIPRVLGVALVAALALSGCKKEAAAPPPIIVTAPAPAPVTVPATASITSVVLGNAVDATGQATAAVSEFAATDAITASVSTFTSDPLATVPGTLSARWLYQDGQVVNEESRSVSFTGVGVTNFQISKPDGWPAGRYTLELSLDGTKVQTREFTVR